MTKDKLKIGMEVIINDVFLHGKVQGYTGIITNFSEPSYCVTIKLHKKFKEESELYLYPDEFECINKTGEQLLLFELT